MATAPTPIDALPAAPDPTTSSSTFDAAAYAWTVALPAFVTSTNALGTNAYNNAVEAVASAVSTAADAISTAADAASAASDAATATAQAASVLDMDKRYLGAKASAPSVDNQGAALEVGANYYDTTLGKLRTWSGSAWVDGISAVAGVSSINGETGAVTFLPTSFLLMSQGVI